MSGEKSLRGRLEEIESNILSIGDEVTTTVFDENKMVFEGDAELDCTRSDSNSRYFIVGKENEEFFSIIYPDSIVAMVAGRVIVDADSDAKISEYLEGDREKIDEEDVPVHHGDERRIFEKFDDDELEKMDEEDLVYEIKKLGAIDILERMPVEEQRKLRFNLRERLSSPETSYELVETEEGVLSGFNVQTKFSMSEEDYTLNYLNDKIQSVTSIGDSASFFVLTSLDASEETITSEEGEEIRQARLGFQPNKSL
ncbi:MAG: hypothetical protein U5J64_05155 [Halobacteriales archaeon]|nr:hypothetical protein [Halobacteriales archaeon]